MKNTIYDDVFRTIAQKMPWLFIALINEVFGTQFSEDIPFEQLRNEHLEQNGKIITDSIFRIEGRLFHIECQSSPDGTMAIRMIEYDLAIALEEAVRSGKPYRITLPDSCVLYLRHRKNTPDRLEIILEASNGQSMLYETRVVKVQEYTRDEIFQKKLLLFLPFYIMRYEGEFEAISKDRERLARFVGEYRDICDRLESDCSTEEKTEMYVNLMDLIVDIADNILPKRSSIKKEVDKVMGGRVLELKSEKLIKQGRKLGKQEGILLGEQHGIQQSIERMAQYFLEQGSAKNLDEAMELAAQILK